MFTWPIIGVDVLGGSTRLGPSSFGGGGGGVAKSCCAVGLEGTGFWRRLIRLCSSISALDCSGLITRYASREKKRTLCPVPGVFPTLRMERMEPNLLSKPILFSVTGVAGGNDGRDEVLSMEGRAVS